MMEFLHSRAFRIYLLATLAVTLVALVITLLIILISGRSRDGGDDIAPSSSPGAASRLLSEQLPDPESLLVPQAWRSPGRVEPHFFREPGLPWTAGRLAPWWTPPREVLQEAVEAKSDRDVRSYLDQIP